MSTTLIERLERHHRHRRGQPRRSCPRRRASPQSLAQARPARLESDRRHAGPARKADPARHQPKCWSVPRTIINEARNGRMFILVDDEDRENEGDLVIPAQMATPDAINFMARHGRGLICLALTKDRADQLGLEPMTRTNRSRNETAFTVSIEATRGNYDRNQRRRPRAHHRRRDRRRLTGPTRSSRPVTSFRWSPARRSAGPRRPHRGGGRRLAPRRPQPERRDLRDHARGRDHGPPRRPDGFRPDARPQDRHDPRSHRLPAEEGPSRRAGRNARRSPRAAARSGRRRCSATSRAARSSSRWSTARSTRPSRCWFGCTASTCSPTCSANP